MFVKLITNHSSSTKTNAATAMKNHMTMRLLSRLDHLTQD
jgi:hypothetical protein